MAPAELPVSLEANPRFLKAPENPPCFFASSPAPCEAIESGLFSRGLLEKAYSLPGRAHREMVRAYTG